MGVRRGGATNDIGEKIEAQRAWAAQVKRLIEVVPGPRDDERPIRRRRFLLILPEREPQPAPESLGDSRK